MAVTKRKIERNLHRIRTNIEIACERARRDPREVTLVAVTKSVDAEAIRFLWQLGIHDLGESRAQQLARRAGEIEDYLRRARAPEEDRWVRWHMIGHLQRNKVKTVLPAAGMVHSVDTLRLAEEINARAEQQQVTVDVLVQVNCSQESQKYGVAVGAAQHLGEMIGTLKNLRLRGLMTMAAHGAPEAEIRQTFQRLGEVFEDMRREGVGGPDLCHLSMGMSQDYPIAVEEGATLIRVGSALFE
jgi:hypothetical protein